VTKRQLIQLVLRAAEISGRTEFVVIGSQAIHGTVADPNIEIVALSNDVDLYPVDGYDERNLVYQGLMEGLGQDSDFDEHTGTYLEAVPVNLAKFPDGWQQRSFQEVVGNVTIGNAPRAVRITFPDIYDLTVSKLAIRRDKDLEFLRGVIELGLVARDVLIERFEMLSRNNDAFNAAGKSDIERAFSTTR